MRAYHPAGLALAVALLAGPAGAQTIDPGLTRAAQCSGVIKGAATVDLALGGDEKDIEADFYLSNTYFLGATKKALGSKPDDAEFLTYQEIHTAALNEVVGVHDAGEWDSQSYEDVITCYAEAGIFFIDELPDYSLNEDKVLKASADQVANIKILLGLN
jgi:hypothetical protein